MTRELRKKPGKKGLRKSLVLLSSGLDSSVNLYWAHRETQVLGAISFDYGQRAAVRELSQSKKLCEKLGVLHRVVPLPFFSDFTGTALVQGERELPQLDLRDFQDPQKLGWTASQVWVPNRNGIFLNIGAAYGEGLGAELVIVGFNREEAQNFPDNRREFLDKTNGALAFSTQNRVEVLSYTVGRDKAEIVQWGLELGLDFGDLWSCYGGGARACGYCESCLRLFRALEKNHLSWESFYGPRA